MHEREDFINESSKITSQKVFNQFIGERLYRVKSLHIIWLVKGWQCGTSFKVAMATL